MRVLHVVGSLGPGGAEKLVFELAKRQSAMGDDVTVAILASPELPSHARVAAVREADLQDHGVAVHQVADGSRALFSGWRGMRSLKWPVPVNVIHAHLIVGAALARLGIPDRPPIVWTLHNTQFGFPRRALRLTRPFVDRYVGCSASVSTALQPLISSPVSTVDNGIELEAFLSARMAREAADASRFRIVSVGGLRPQKNYARLVSAAILAERNLSPRGVDLTLSIVGDGEQRGPLSRLITNTGSERFIRLMGARSDIGQMMAQSDCFAMSSDHEGLPLSLIESMAVGLPCLLTPFEGAAAITSEGRAALIAPSFAVEDLASCIVQLATDEGLRQRLAAEAVSRAGYFSIERCAADYQRIYEEVLISPLQR